MLRLSCAASLAATVLMVSGGARAAPKVAVVPLSAGDRSTARAARSLTAQLVRKLRQRRFRVVVVPNRRGLRVCMQQPSCVQGLSDLYRVKRLIAGHAERIEGLVHLDVLLISGDGTIINSRSLRSSKQRNLARRLPNVARAMIRSGARVAVAAPRSPEPDAERPGAAEYASRIAEDDGEDPLEPAEDAAGDDAGKAEDDVAAAEAALKSPPSSTGKKTRAVATAASASSKEPGTLGRLWSRRYWAGWTTAGIGVAALTAGAVFGAISASADKAAVNAELQLESWTLRDKAEKNALFANVLFAVGGASLVSSLILFYLENDKDLKERRARRVGLDVRVAGSRALVGINGRF